MGKHYLHFFETFESTRRTLSNLNLDSASDGFSSTDRGENTKPNNWRNNFKQPKDVSLFGICRHKKWFFLNYSCHLFVFFMFLKLILSSKETWCFSKNVFFLFFSGWFRHLLFLKTLAFKTAKTKTAPFLFPIPLEAMVRRAFESHVVPYLKPPNCRFLATRWLNPWMNLPPKTKMAKWKITTF